MENKNQKKGKLYILNSPVLTNYGLYVYEKIDRQKAKTIIEQFNKEFTSAIGHEATASLLSKLLGVNIPANRIQITMEDNDVAIVLKLNQRIPEGKVLSVEEMEQIGYELGYLGKLG